MLKKGFIVTMLFIAIQFLFITGASAQTTISDDAAEITSPVTWDLANSPYIINQNVTVGEEGSLTIEPGVVVKFNKSKGLYVEGTLNALGTADKHIVFTDYRDDVAGGDTNGDGSVTAPSAGYWAGIKVTGTATMDYCDVRYAGDYNEANLYKTGTEPLTLTNSTISNSLKDGLRIYESEGATILENCTFKDNKRYGIQIENIEIDSYTGTGNLFTNNKQGNVCIQGGTLMHDLTWSLEGSPYYIKGDVTVDETAVLTVSPGVVVKFAKNMGLYIEGTLTAQGNSSASDNSSSSSNTIYFTDYRDDLAGGDTNADGVASKPTAGWWGGIKISGGGNATISDCVVRYAGYHNESGIHKTGTGLLTLANSTISDSIYDGLHISYNAVASTTVNNCIFKDNARYGIHIDDIENDSYTGTGNSFINNSKAPVCIEGGILKHNITWNIEGSPYHIKGDVTVDENAVLTVDPSVAVKFAESTGLYVTGTLTAKGIPTGNGSTGTIYFTDYRDDAAGGDTNGDEGAAKPAPGWWAGISISASGTATMDNCVIRYGGYYNEGNIYKTGLGALILTNSELSNSMNNGLRISYNVGTYTIIKNKIHSNKVGISCEASYPVIGGSQANANRIYQNADFGVENKSDDTTINAKYNWWGDVTGPTHAHNPLGKGDKVSDYVDYGNYLTSNTSLLPDLAITTGTPTATPTTVVAGNKVSLSAWTVKNIGTAASVDFSNGFYLSTDPAITTADTYLADNSNLGLAAGAEFAWGSPLLTIPLSTLPGNYYVGILVDKTNAVAESNKTNNYVSVPITVTSTNPTPVTVVFDPKTNIPTDKSWTIKFNQDIYKGTSPNSSVNNQNITVIDDQNNPISVTFSPGSDLRSVIVKAPAVGYVSGKTYTIIVKNIQNVDKKIIGKQYTMKFTIS